MPTINFTGVEAGKFDPIPASIYDATVYSIEFKTKKDDAGGPGFYEWQFAIQEGEYKGRRQWMNTSLKPQALWKLMETIQAFGIEVPKGPFNFEPEQFFGKPCRIKVTLGTWEGKPSNNVDTVMPPKGNVVPGPGSSVGMKTAATPGTPAPQQKAAGLFGR